eukprot:6124671-Amphidinium_carterae.1
MAQSSINMSSRTMAGAQPQSGNVPTQVAQGQSHGFDESADDNEAQKCRQWHRAAVDKPGDTHAFVSDNDSGEQSELARFLYNEYIDTFDNDFVLTSLLYAALPNLRNVRG